MRQFEGQVVHLVIAGWYPDAGIVTGLYPAEQVVHWFESEQTEQPSAHRAHYAVVVM